MVTRVLEEILNRWPTVGLALGVVRNETPEFYTHGLADIASKTRITEETVFRIASISKTFVSISAMQLWEQGLIDLDAPANDYLRSYKLVSAKAKHRPATLRHLLTHTSSIPSVVYSPYLQKSAWFEDSFELGQPLPTLAEYYRGVLRLTVEPGTKYMYSDHGIATLGQIVEDVSGMPIDRYLHENIFELLGMSSTSLTRPGLLATGYKMGYRGAKAVTDRKWVAVSATSVYTTPRDMARYLTALLGNTSIIGAKTLSAMYKSGLGFFPVNLGEKPAVHHRGLLPGFHSQIFLAPDDGVGVMAFANTSRRDIMWLKTEVESLLRKILSSK